MAATTGPLSTCSSPVLFLIAREWQCNKHLRRNLFTKSEFKNKATIGECFVSHLSELLYLRCQRSGLPDPSSDSSALSFVSPPWWCRRCGAGGLDSCGGSPGLEISRASPISNIPAALPASVLNSNSRLLSIIIPEFCQLIKIPIPAASAQYAQRLLPASLSVFGMPCLVRGG